jgi:hypothetical protein
MNTTTIAQKNSSSSTITNFLKEKYIVALQAIIANIKANTVHSIEMFIAHEGKYKGIPKSYIPLESDIRTGFETIEGMLRAGHFSLINDALVIAFDKPSIGETFSTAYFEKQLKPMPDRFFPGFAITLSDRILGKLENVEPQREKDLETLWEKENFGDKIRVEFMDGFGDHNIGDHMEFVLWFAPKLASNYLKWCIDREAINKCVAIAKCLRNKSPYSACLTSATIRKSAAAAAAADSSSDRGCSNKKRRTNN